MLWKRSQTPEGNEAWGDHEFEDLLNVALPVRDPRVDSQMQVAIWI